MDCKHCEEYVDRFTVFPIYGITGPEYQAQCPMCLRWTRVDIEFDPPTYRMTMDGARD